MFKTIYKVQAAAKLLETTVDSVRRYVDEAGVKVARQTNGPKTRQFTIENIFDIASWRQENKPKIKIKKKRVITVYAPKGGVGKTTLAANLACVFSLMGLKTLVIDLDFQANLTLSFGYDSEITDEEAEELEIPFERVVKHHFGHLVPGWPGGRMKLEDVLKMPFGASGPHLIPSDLTLDRLDTILTYDALEGKKSDLKIAALISEGLSSKNEYFNISNYDIVIFDAAPAKNRMTRGALLSSDYVLAPVSLERYSTKAVSYLSSVLQDMRDDFGRSPEMIMIGNFHLPNRLRVYSQVSKLSSEYPGSLLNVMIHRSEEFPKTLSEEDVQPPLVLAKPTGTAAEQIHKVGKEILHKMEMI
ncbi:ParA family protein [Zoogloea sp.]|uniref:ParA family protein n=1 Tax=Zoogloea sp. TaxID=49181 RepID=UPI0026160D43|nr:ParA family protein [Zoogloea sp.]MDD3353259.1 ParA family protein [Zoogloea sp.]